VTDSGFLNLSRRLLKLPEFPGVYTSHIFRLLRLSTHKLYIFRARSEFDLDDDTAFFVRNSIAPTTRRSYGRAWKAFLAWAEKRGALPLPAQGAVVSNYLAAIAARTGAPHSGASALSAIRFVHSALSLPQPEVSPKVMQGIRLALGKPANQSKALTGAILRKLLQHLLGLAVDGDLEPDPADPLKRRRQATPLSWRTAIIATLSFAASARFDDLRHLTRGQIGFHTDGDLLIHFWAVQNQSRTQ